MIVSLWLGLREFGQDFDFAAPPHDTTVQTLAPNESLLRRLWLQTNLYCADKLQTNHYCADKLQTNHYCAGSGSKLLTTEQTLPPN